MSALRFLYRVTLQKRWSFDDVLPAPKKPQSLPVVLSPQEVVQFLDAVKPAKHRAILTACYAAGLRISEAIALTVSAVDSERMVLRIAKGKGQKEPLRDALAEAARGPARLVESPTAPGNLALATATPSEPRSGPFCRRPSTA